MCRPQGNILGRQMDGHGEKDRQSDRQTDRQNEQTMDRYIERYSVDMRDRQTDEVNAVG